MKVRIALFRAVNIGGHNKLPMASLAALLEALGCRDVRTYIQSGNAVFRGPEGDAATLAARIGDAVRERHGFRPGVLVLGIGELEQAVADNPFPEAETAPRSVHLFFLSDVPTTPDLDALNSARADSESFVLGDRVLYFHAPDGVGRSKFPGRVERALGVGATGRNWRTVCTLLGMARSLP